MLYKPNMITQGAEWKEKCDSAKIGWLTVRTFSRCFVPAVPGIVLLSGGQS